MKHGTWMLFPLVIKTIIDDFIPAEDMEKILWCIPLVLALGIVNLIFSAWHSVLLSDAVRGTSRDIRDAIIQKLQLLSLSYHNKSETGRHYSKIMRDVERIEQFVLLSFALIIGAALTFFYAFLVLAFVNLKMLVAFSVVMPLYFLIYKAFSSHFEKYQHAARMASEDLSQSVNQFIQTSALARIHGEEEFESQKVSQKSESVIEKYRRISYNIGVFRIAIAGTGQVFMVSTVALAAYLVIGAQMKIGELVLFLQYGNVMINTIARLVQQFPLFTEFRESVVSIREILNAPDHYCPVIIRIMTIG